MSDLTVPAQITSSDGTTTLSLQSSTIVIVSVNAIGRKYRETIETGDTTDYGTVTAAAIDIVRPEIVVRVFGSNMTTLNSNVQGLVDILTDWSYTVSVPVNGSSQSWVGLRPADIEPDGGSWDKFALMNTPPRQAYRFTFPARRLDGAL